MNKQRRSSSNVSPTSKKQRVRKTFGVVVGLKAGQKHLDTALKVKEIAVKKGKDAYVLAGREITPEVVLEFPPSTHTSHGLPPHKLGGTKQVSKPVLTVSEFMVVLGEVSWENLLKKGLFEN